MPQIALAHAGCIVSGDTTGFAKPHPAPLLEGARRLNLAPEQCWYVGDDLRDIEAGKAAGMVTVACAWGYCGAIAPSTWGADYLFDTPDQLLAALRDVTAGTSRADQAARSTWPRAPCPRGSPQWRPFPGAIFVYTSQQVTSVGLHLFTIDTGMRLAWKWPRN